jgi:UPF0716 protein FxsA
MLSPRVALFLLFIGFPLAEIALLIKAGEVIGFWPTVGILFLSAVLGFAIIRDQGMAMVGRMVATVQEGRLPLETMLDSYVRVIAGCLLVAPGLISDVIGLVLLVPPLRRLGLRWAIPDLANPSAGPGPSGARPGQSGKSGRPIVIEGTYERVDDRDEDKDKPEGTS